MGKKDITPKVDERYFIKDSKKLCGRNGRFLEEYFINKKKLKEGNAKVDMLIYHYPTFKGDFNLVFRYPLPKWEKPPIIKDDDYDEVEPIFEHCYDDEIHKEFIIAESLIKRKRERREWHKFQ